ncbi:MAG: beta galactosidase jelly roll domain-containing protein [Nibricoccus sp.]
MALLRTCLHCASVCLFALTGVLVAAEPARTRMALDAAPWQLHFVDGEPNGGKGKPDGTELPDSFANNDGWSPIRVGTSWEEQGHARNGVGWYRTRFTIPDAWKGQPLVLNLGRPDDGGEAFLNGKRLGAVTRFGDQLRFRIKPEDVRVGADNYVAVRVWDWYQAGGLNTGDFSIERYGPAMQEAPTQTPASLALPIMRSLKDDVIKTPGWSWGWRDAGTSDTRPKLAPARGALNGTDALSVRVDRTGSTEFFDVQLPAGCTGTAWRQAGAAALQFWIKSDDTEGEIQLRLNHGRYRWGGGAQSSYMARTVQARGRLATGHRSADRISASRARRPV